LTLTEALIPRHVVSNVLITESKGDAGTAHVKSHLFYYEVTPDGFYFKTSGIYTDVVVRAEGTWKFRSRVMTLDVAKAP
ncbi:MAG TPA: nuclear transport factor 2 family protein, partial [Rhodospirillales bacterium]|nr:nuclear transport factor 2 family protein [Rhodospirillales bacterium]